MEIEGADGSKLALKSGSKTTFGRGSGFNTDDRTVSRRHVELELETLVDENGETRTEEPSVSFEVTGLNPVWVRRGTNGEIKVFNSSDKGRLENGDWICVSGRVPVWFVLKKTEENGKEERDLGSESGAESVDIEDIDPVKEFGFIVIGHEFDRYPNQRIRNIKNWEWFLEEHGNGSDDDDDDEAVERKRGRSKGKKRKKGDNDDDDDWTGESEGEIEEVATKGRKARGAVYSTRSKDRDKSKKNGGKIRSSTSKKTVTAGEESSVDDDDEDDETLGGFIVEDDDAELEEEGESDEEVEEDFDDEDEDNND